MLKRCESAEADRHAGVSAQCRLPALGDRPSEAASRRETAVTFRVVRCDPVIIPVP